MTRLRTSTLRRHGRSARHWPAPADSSGATTDADSQSGALALVRDLCAELERRRVDYCHWKSTNALDRSADGRNDLDLLIAREHGTEFAQVVSGLGFKAALDPEEQRPGVVDYFGYDRPSGRLVHLQAHFQLIVGHDRTKNVRLPVERAYLASCRHGELFRIPDPAHELVVLVLRLTIKHATWDAIVAGQGVVSTNALAEVDYLEGLTDAQAVAAALRALGLVDETLFRSCRQTLDGNRPAFARARTAADLLDALGGDVRHGQGFDVSLKLARRTRRSAQRRTGRRLRARRLRDGGAVVAVIGSDGSGKSTAIGALHGWLAGGGVEAQAFHLGKPPWSSTTTTARGALALASRLGSRTARRYAPLVWETCAARDRERQARIVGRYATRGGVALCDRFPLGELDAMDAPQVAQLAESAEGLNRRVVSWLTRIEDRSYQQIRRPDLVLVLRVDPAVAIARKPDDGAAYVRRRAEAVWSAPWRSDAVIIDAGRPAAEVAAELRRKVWQAL